MQKGTFYTTTQLLFSLFLCSFFLCCYLGFVFSVCFGVVCVFGGVGGPLCVILRGGLGFLLQASTAASSWYYQWESSRHDHHPWWLHGLF